MNWDKIKGDIKEILKKNTCVSMMHHLHGVNPAPLCFATGEEYDNFIDDVLEYIKGLIETNKKKKKK